MERGRRRCAKVFILGPFFGGVVDGVCCCVSGVGFFRWRMRNSLEAADLLELVFSESMDFMEMESKASWEDELQLGLDLGCFRFLGFVDVVALVLGAIGRFKIL